MRRLHEVKIDDAKYYEKIWGEEFNTRPYYDAVRMRALAKYVKAGDRVLDVGGGVFGTAQYIAEHTGISADLTIVDQSHTAAEILAAEQPSVNFVISDVASLPFSSGSFSIVIAGEIIEHMEDPAAFVVELARVLDTGGHITLSTVDTECANAIAHGDYPEHLWEFDLADLSEFFLAAGLKDVSTYMVGDYLFAEGVK